jgi:hypothetical protein
MFVLLLHVNISFSDECEFSDGWQYNSRHCDNQCSDSWAHCLRSNQDHSRRHRHVQGRKMVQLDSSSIPLICFGRFISHVASWERTGCYLQTKYPSQTQSATSAPRSLPLKSRLAANNIDIFYYISWRVCQYSYCTLFSGI